MNGFRSARHRALVEKAIAAGWRHRDNGAHIVLYPPDGTQPVVASRTAYDRDRSLHATLKRKGLDV